MKVINWIMKNAVCLLCISFMLVFNACKNTEDCQGYDPNSTGNIFIPDLKVKQYIYYTTGNLPDTLKYQVNSNDKRNAWKESTGIGTGGGCDPNWTVDLFNLSDPRSYLPHCPIIYQSYSHCCYGTDFEICDGFDQFDRSGNSRFYETITLNGKEYKEVTTFWKNDSSNVEVKRIYLQKSKGIVAFETSENIWSLVE
ncbi:MAG: hypothetical protein J7604_01615 [Sporocytophaga sp.]|uniref:hypothetical protein n=1 Tax=Sporocytophaga sp. TaxID=2231183 RepID=UPI001B140536|nr:hypothetical protein [Sporocytophaga sp.]MBO9698871.1 hypothetical protein [Sporocytophaga sp.]